MGEESIIAAFSSAPFELGGELLCVEAIDGAAIIGDGRALVADLYECRVGRMWRVGEAIAPPPEHYIDVAFDTDMRQERGDVNFRAKDHPGLDASAAEGLIGASRVLVDQIRKEGKLRVRGFTVRAFGDTRASVALLSLFILDNALQRSASFSYAVVAIGPRGDVRTVCEQVSPRGWTPRL